jgi:hypothetical protein
MRLVFGGVAVAGALSAAMFLFVPGFASTPTARRFVVSTRTAVRPMPDAAARLSLRRVAVIGAGQARTLRRAVRRCARTGAPARCPRMALAHAAAGARLNGFILSQIVVRLPAGPCRRFAGRLGGLMAALAYVADEGVRAIGTSGAMVAAAKAASRVGGRVISFRRRAPRGRCAGGVLAYRPAASSHSRIDV